MTRPPALLAGLLVLAALAGGCGDVRAVREQGEVRATPLDERPTLTLLRPDGPVDLPAWTYCYQHETGGSSVGGCADGVPPKRPPRLVADGSAAFTFAQDGWTFLADFRPAGARQQPACVPQRRILVTREADRYVIPALGPAGVWDVDVTGRSTTELGNDLATTFRWVTSVDSDVPVPAYAAVSFLYPDLPSIDGEAASPSVTLTGLSPEPHDVAGSFTVRAGSGEEQTFALEPVGDDCAEDGVVGLRQPGAHEELDVVGDAPFTYVVEVTLDQTTHVGTAIWPDDLESPGSSDVLVTSWEPPLPESAVRR